MPDPSPNLTPGAQRRQDVMLTDDSQRVVQTVVLVNSAGEELLTSSNGDGTCTLVTTS